MITYLEFTRFGWSKTQAATPDKYLDSRDANMDSIDANIDTVLVLPIISLWKVHVKTTNKFGEIQLKTGNKNWFLNYNGRWCRRIVWTFDLV